VKSCPHLEPLEQELARQGVALGEPAVSPYGPSAGLWCACNCVFDEPSLRARLKLPATIRYDEYDGRVAGSDATFFCPECKRAIMGIHPNYARPTTPRVA